MALRNTEVGTGWREAEVIGTLAGKFRLLRGY
jgi:hypothetical protein